MLNIKYPVSLSVLQKSRHELESMSKEKLVDLILGARPQIDDVLHYFWHVQPQQQASRGKKTPWPDGVHRSYFEAYRELLQASGKPPGRGALEHAALQRGKALGLGVEEFKDRRTRDFQEEMRIRRELALHYPDGERMKLMNASEEANGED